jgi:GR25 family glycosyltransferase involved in LPS biosynthesis
MINLTKDFVVLNVNDSNNEDVELIISSLAGYTQKNIKTYNGYDVQDILSFFQDNPQVKKNNGYRQRDLTQLMSHYNVAKFIVENNLDGLWVFEDNAKISQSFTSDIENVKQDIPDDFDFFMAQENNLISKDYIFSKNDVVNRVPLFSTEEKPDVVHQDWEIGSDKIVKAYQWWGLGGYYINKTGAQKVINFINTNGFNVGDSAASFNGIVYSGFKFDVFNGYQQNPLSSIDRLVKCDPLDITDSEKVALKGEVVRLVEL